MEKINGFKNTNILTEEGIVKANLIIEDGIIKRIGNFCCDNLIELPDDKIVIPGFIDQHIHGAGGNEVMDGTIEAIENLSNVLPQEGTTSYLPTTDTHSIERIKQALIATNEYIKLNKETGSQVLGIHLEGPFLARKYTGAMVPEYIIKPNLEIYKQFENISGNNIKLVTLAIEEEGSDELIKYLKANDINISIGHSNATYQEIKDSITKGITCMTHTYNAMRPLRRDEIGMVGSTLLFDELYSEAICDGIHVSKPALKLLWKNKPNDKFILVTDSLRPKYLPKGIYPEADQIIVVEDDAARLDNGRLAGSILKMNQAVKNIIDFLEIDFETAIKCATINPAKNLKVDNLIGSIKEGKLANLVIVDKDVNVYQTIRNGNVIYTNPNYKNN